MSERHRKINDLLRDEVGAILLHELDLDFDALVTVTRVTVSEDLNNAKVLVSVLPDKFTSIVLAEIKKNVYAFQQLLNRLGNLYLVAA